RGPGQPGAQPRSEEPRPRRGERDARLLGAHPATSRTDVAGEEVGIDEAGAQAVPPDRGGTTASAGNADGTRGGPRAGGGNGRERPLVSGQGHLACTKWHFLYFFPDPHGQGSLRPTLSPVAVRAA